MTIEPDVLQREATRLRQCADILEQDAEWITAKDGAYIVPTNQAAMAGLREVRKNYKSIVSSHAAIHMVEVAKHLRLTADILTGIRDPGTGLVAS